MLNKFFNKIFTISLAIVVVVFGVFLYKKAIAIPSVDFSKVKNQSLIDYSTKHNYRQTILHCGPFSVAAVNRALKKEEINSADVVRHMSWKVPKLGYHPWGLEKALRENGIEIETPNLDGFIEIEKVEFLKLRLSEGKPIILLGEKNGVQHYVTLFGFDSNKDEFYIYDSWHTKSKPGFTEDDNGNLPGNRTLKTSELLDFWRNGGVFGAYTWYAIVSSF